MATPLSASQMVAALKKEGVKIFERDGWRTHNRNGHGAWGPVNGVMIHHTAGSDTAAGANLVYNGRSDLPGPLSHAYLRKDGTVVLTGHGRANHAGSGDSDVLERVISDRSAMKPKKNDIDGNARFYGIEIANLGNGKDPYPAVQYNAAVRWAAAICRAHGWSEMSVIGHKEWTNTKIDPSFDMNKFRKDVAARLTPTKTPESPPKPSTPSTIQDLPLSNPPMEGGPFQLDISRNSTSTLVPETWYDIAFPTETTDEGGVFTLGDYRINCAGTYDGVLYVKASNVLAGDEIQVRLVERQTSTGSVVKIHPIAEGLGTQGGTFLAIPINGLLPNGRTLGVQIANYTTQDVFMESVNLKMQHWVRFP